MGEDRESRLSGERLVRPDSNVSRLAPPSAAVGYTLHLQRAVGNSAVLALLQRTRGKKGQGGNNATTNVNSSSRPGARPTARNTTPPAADDVTTIWWINPMTIRYAQDTIDRSFTNRSFGTVDMPPRTSRGSGFE